MTDPHPTRRSSDPPSLLRSRRTGLALLLTGLLMGTVITADVSAPPDEAGVQQAVARQLRALAAEDARSAYALTNDGLRAQFANAEAFLDTLRTEYPMVVDPISVLFMKPHSDGQMAMQKVRLTDSEGMAWLVTYLLERKDGRWLISGTLIESDGLRILA